MLQAVASAAILVSTILSIVSYLPQISRLLKVKDSTGISIKAWVISIVSLALYTLYAALVADIKLMLSMGACTVMGALILSLALRYRK